MTAKQHLLDTAPRDGTYIEVRTNFAVIRNVYWCDEASAWAEGGRTFHPPLPSSATWRLMDEPVGTTNRTPTAEVLEAVNKCLNDGPFKHNSPGLRLAVALALDDFAGAQLRRGYDLAIVKLYERAAGGGVAHPMRIAADWLDGSRPEEVK